MNILNNRDIQKIIFDVQQNNWNADYAIRYVVVSISRFVKRDPKFFLAPEKERLNLIGNMNYQKDYPYVICKTLHELIKEVLDILGIQSKVVIATNTTIPLYALIVEGEHSRYFIDALHDLFRSQYRIKPVSYGARIKSNTSILDNDKNQLQDLPLDYIKKIDLDTGLIQEEYFSDAINRIKIELTDRNKAKALFLTNNSYELLKRKIEHISENYLNVYPVDGPIERVGLHVYLRSNLFNRSEKANFYVGNRIDKENNPVYIIIKYGPYNITFEEVFDHEKYLLKETTESIAPRTFK